MRVRSEDRGDHVLSAKAGELEGAQPGEAGAEGDVSYDGAAGEDAGEDDVTGRALRLLQLHDDARQEFERAEEKLQSVRDEVDRALAGEFDVVVDVPIVVPVVEQPVRVERKRSRFVMAGLVAAGLVIATGVAVLLTEARRGPDVASSRGTIVTEAVAAVAPVSAPVVETVSLGRSAGGAAGQEDLGQTIYASLFAKAPAAERTCLARAVYYEARGEDMSGQIAVAQVVLNRARSKKWPSTICGVVNQGIERGEKCQFSFACFTQLSQPSGEMWEQAQQVADQAMRGQAWLRELVEATHYHTTSVAPVWRTGLVEIATIGTHVFYRDGDGLRAKAHDAPAYQAAAAAQAVRSKVAGITKAVRPKAATGEAAAGVPTKASAGHGGDWKASVFSQ